MPYSYLLDFVPVGWLTKIIHMYLQVMEIKICINYHSLQICVTFVWTAVYFVYGGWCSYYTLYTILYLVLLLPFFRDKCTYVYSFSDSICSVLLWWSSYYTLCEILYSVYWDKCTSVYSFSASSCIHYIVLYEYSWDAYVIWSFMWNFSIFSMIAWIYIFLENIKQCKKVTHFVVNDN